MIYQHTKIGSHLIATTDFFEYTTILNTLYTAKRCIDSVYNPILTLAMQLDIRLHCLKVGVGCEQSDSL